jgi:hypothetical protein
LTSSLGIEPAPTPGEAAAIAAALVALGALEGQRKRPEDRSSLNRNRWRLAGLFGHAVPPGMRLDGSLWAYSSWEGMV